MTAEVIEANRILDLADDNKARDEKLATMGYTDMVRLRTNCRQCGYDRVGYRKGAHGKTIVSRTCAWCGATGKQRSAI
jgi:hypothetical protein